ncbi:MAG: hypothetical protein IKG56_02285 [Clostridia bacterium]|nr:hypothetical protein [Clostridia bacterium]
MNQILSNHDKEPNKKNNNKYHNNYYYNGRNQQQNYNSNYRNRQNNYNSNYIDKQKNYNKYYYQKNQVYEKLSIDTITRVFAIIIILFGIGIIANSVYALNLSDNKPKDIPTVSLEKMGKEVTITVETQQPIKEMKYRWNDGEDTEIKSNGTSKLIHTIDVPNGNNILIMTVVDCYGNKTRYQRQYIYESTDVTKPTIDIAGSGTKLIISIADETKLAYVTYRWNDGEDFKYEMQQDQKEAQIEIEVMQGKNELTVIAVDGEDNRTTINKSIIGDTKPEVSISTEGNNIVVNVKDDEGIKKLEVTIDGNTTEQDTENNKEITAKIPVDVGTHEISATAINVNGLKATKEISANI